MVTTTNMSMHYRGLSSDTSSLPTDAPNGSDFLEMDTGKTWYFDAENGAWLDPTATPDNNDG